MARFWICGQVWGWKVPEFSEIASARNDEMLCLKAFVEGFVPVEPMPRSSLSSPQTPGTKEGKRQQPLLTVSGR